MSAGAVANAPARMPPPLRFTPEEAEQAWEQHCFNCGPAALAAICELTIEQSVSALPGFDTKHYTNPTMMFEGLKALGVKFSVKGPYNNPGRQPKWPSFGLARIQWGGTWTGPKVPMGARYRRTHWVGSCVDPARGIGIFDVNALVNRTGWLALAQWIRVIVPHLLKDMKGADGSWWITHAVEIL